MVGGGDVARPRWEPVPPRRRGPSPGSPRGHPITWPAHRTPATASTASRPGAHDEEQSARGVAMICARMYPQRTWTAVARCLADAFLAGVWNEARAAAPRARRARPAAALAAARRAGGARRLSPPARGPSARARALRVHESSSASGAPEDGSRRRRFGAGSCPNRRWAGCAGRCPRSPSLGALGAFLSLPAGELAWLADMRGLERSVADERLRHYRYAWLARGDGRPVRVIEQPKPRLKAVQRDRAARDPRSDPGARACPRVHPRALGGEPRGGARRPAGRRAPGPRGLLRLDRGGPHLRHLPHRGLPGGGRARADGADDERRAVGGLGRRPAPARAGADHGPPPARAPPGDARTCRRARRRHRRSPTSRRSGSTAGSAGLARALSATYTRYADDLTFSGGTLLLTRAERAARDRRHDRPGGGLHRQRAQVGADDAGRPPARVRDRRQRASERRARGVRPAEGDPPQRGACTGRRLRTAPASATSGRICSGASRGSSR